MSGIKRPFHGWIEIYKMLRNKATELNVNIDTHYRYVVTDAFFEFVANEHEREIEDLKKQIKDGGMDYA